MRGTRSFGNPALRSDIYALTWVQVHRTIGENIFRVLLSKGRSDVGSAAGGRSGTSFKKQLSFQVRGIHPIRGTCFKIREYQSEDPSF